jgi:hypothetical protein
VLLGGGDRGPAKKACATQPAQTLLLDKMSTDVTVTGTLVRKGGVQMIYIDTVK